MHPCPGYSTDKIATIGPGPDRSAQPGPLLDSYPSLEPHTSASRARISSSSSAVAWTQRSRTTRCRGSPGRSTVLPVSCPASASRSARAANTMRSASSRIHSEGGSRRTQLSEHFQVSTENEANRPGTVAQVDDMQPTPAPRI